MDFYWKFLKFVLLGTILKIFHLKINSTPWFMKTKSSIYDQLDPIFSKLTTNRTLTTRILKIHKKHFVALNYV